MRRVKNEVEKDEQSDNFRHFHIQLWVSKKKEARNERELFCDCWLSKWKCNLTNPKQWVNISSVLFSFLVRNNVIINSIIMISAIDATKVK
jgi:threonine/homoserine/homoserine lactone efflux protein